MLPYHNSGSQLVIQAPLIMAPINVHGGRIECKRIIYLKLTKPTREEYWGYVALLALSVTT